MEIPERHWDTEQQRWIYPGDLPPPPEPTAIVRRWTTNSVSVDIPPPLLGSLQDGERLYTEDQMRSYGESCARMAREEAARIAEGMEDIAGPTVHDVARAIRKG